MYSILNVNEFFNYINNYDQHKINIYINADNTAFLLDELRPIIYKNNTKLRMKLINIYQNFFDNNNKMIDDILNVCNTKFMNKIKKIYIIGKNGEHYLHLCNKYLNTFFLYFDKLDDTMKQDAHTIFFLDAYDKNVNINSIIDKRKRDINVILLRCI